MSMRRLRSVILLACLLMAAIGPRAAAQTNDPNLCAGLPDARLRAGGQAKVVAGNSTRDPGPPGAYLKTEPLRVGPVIRYLPLDTVISIREDVPPQCTLDGDRWWPVELDKLQGWMTESSGQNYVLEPFEGQAPEPLPSTVSPLLFCVRPKIEPQATREAPIGTGEPTLRIAFGGADGTLQYSDNLGATRIVAQFNPAPLSIDLSPDGSAALVVNYNGVYWVDMLTGTIVFLADGTTFGLGEDVWPRRALWMPDGGSAAVELEDTRGNEYSFPLWDLTIDGLSQTFRVDVGNTPRNSVRMPMQRDKVIFLSANSIEPYPRNSADEPDPLLIFVPRAGDSADARSLVPPAISWTSDGRGIYTYIPTGDEAPESDTVGGRLWYLSLDEPLKDLGKPANVQPEDYVIPSQDGKYILLGTGANWRIQEPESGKVVQVLPPVQYLFDWTPDSKGVVFTTQDARVGYLGVDGSTTSEYVPPAADNLFGINWLMDGTALYIVRGADGKLTYSVRRPGKDPAFIGFVNTPDSFTAGLYTNPPGFGEPPKPCE